MYINDRDQINYHGFLKALREMQAVYVVNVSEGICSKSEVTRMENGDRLPEKLLRDRITSRLGVSGEEYEEYLRTEEYRQWKTRMHILDCIDKGKIGEAMENLEVLKEISEDNPVTRQFIETMRYMCMQLTGAPIGERRAQIYYTMIHTVSSPEMAFAGAHLLADQELNLILEYMHIRECDVIPANEKEWRMKQYRRLMEYIDRSYIDAIGKAKLYPKVAHFVCELLVKDGASDEDLTYALELCTKSIEMLRDVRRLYYFVELLEWRREVLTCLLDKEENADRRALFEKNNEWETLIKELYKEYKVPAHMETFTYLYVETECNDVAHVIHTRRRMLKLSREKLGGEVCTDKTVKRIETYKNSPTIYVMRELFNTLNLCPEYRRARVITSEPEVLRLANRLVVNVNNYEYEEWEKNLAKLRELLPMDVSFNDQAILFMENLLEYKKERINREEYVNRNRRALEVTISVEAVMRNNNKYFTKSEWTCLGEIAFESTDKLAVRCRDIIETTCTDQIDREIEVARLSLFELLMSGLVNYLGNQQEFERSNRLIEKIMKECLFNRRLINTYFYVYNYWWNNIELAKHTGEKVCLTYSEKMLNRTIWICEVTRIMEAIPFFEDKLNQIYIEQAEN